MPRKAMESLTETMFYVLMAFCKGSMCGIDVAEFIEKRTKGRILIGPATLYTILGKFEKEKYIKEIQNDEYIHSVINEEFDFIKTKTKEQISKTIAKTFEKSKELKADVFGAFDIANKFHYKKTNQNFDDMEKFLESLKLNVQVDVSRLEY